jgi:hypothetical protein
MQSNVINVLVEIHGNNTAKSVNESDLYSAQPHIVTIIDGILGSIKIITLTGKHLFKSHAR